jgi:hypothetical protein
MRFAIINLSPSVSESDAELMTGAVTFQMANHVVPAWNLEPATFELYTSIDCAPADAMQVVITDDADRLGAYGYHDSAPGGQSYGRVFVQESLVMGGTVLGGAQGVSATLSHEVIEAAIDPGLDQWRAGPDGDWALEIADMVESQSYTIDVAGHPVAVSNFVLPAYFVAGSTGRLDHLGTLDRAFTLADGGYAAVRSTDGAIGRIPPGNLVRGSKSHPAARPYRRGLR